MLRACKIKRERGQKTGKERETRWSRRERGDKREPQTSTRRIVPQQREEAMRDAGKTFSGSQMKRERVQVAGVGEDDGLGRLIRRERGDRGAP